MTQRRRVLVIGAGPAGLAAAAHLLEQASDRVQVRLLHMGHHLGGKASSHRGRDGEIIEHGWHMVLGFYRRMFALMERAGIDRGRALVSMGGQSHAYEPSSGRLSTVSSQGGRVEVATDFLGYEGMPLGDRLNYGRVMAETFGFALSGQDLRRHDDICFRTWAIEHGMRPHVTRYSLFRFLREAYFNFPEAISAYHVLKTLSHMSTSEESEAFVVRGGFTDRIWQPIARYLRRLGCEIVPYQMATDWIYEGRRIVGVAFARPDSHGHETGHGPWPPSTISVNPRTVRVERDFDYIISTVPHAVLARMNADDTRMWESSYYRRIRNLRSASTVSMTVLTERPVMAFAGPVFGLPAPLGICTNMKPYWDRYAEDDTVGAALHFVGQEAGFEEWSDEQIVSFTLEQFSRLPGGAGSIREAGIRSVEIHRNRSDHERLMLCEPGVQQFRPGPLTPFENLFLAGDWVENEVDLICMEGAIASAQASANELLRRAFA